MASPGHSDSEGGKPFPFDKKKARTAAATGRGAIEEEEAPASREGMPRLEGEEALAARVGMMRLSRLEREVEAPAAATEGATRLEGEEPGLAVAREGMTRLPQLEVLKILTRDPRSMELHSVGSLLRRVQEELPGLPEEVQLAVAGAVTASLNEDMRQEFVVFQDWVRGEVEEKGYVEVPDEFVSDREEASERHGVRIDLLLSSRYFTTVLGDDGKEKRVFSFTTKEKAEEEKAVSGSKSKEGNVLVSSSAKLHPEVKRRLWGDV